MSGAIRILHVVEAFGGGVMQMLVPLAEDSAAMGHSVAVLYGRRPETPIPVRDRIDRSVEVLPLPGERRSVRDLLRAVARVRHVVEEWRPDIVHLHSSFSGVVGGLAIRNGPPTIFTPNCFASAIDHPAALRSLYRGGESFACRRATVVGAVSWSEGVLARRRGARRVVHVPNGLRELDPGWPVATRDGAAGGPRVVAVGRTVAQQRPAASARILGAVADIAGVEWLGGGGGAGGAAGAEALRAGGIPVSGWLPRDELLRALADCTACLHWSAWDGLSLSVLEAIALGVAVVASDIPPNREILGSGGVCGTESDASELLRRLVLEPELAEALRAEQRERAAAFGARSMVAGWHGLYEELAIGGRDAR